MVQDRHSFPISNGILGGDADSVVAIPFNVSQLHTSCMVFNFDILADHFILTCGSVVDCVLVYQWPQCVGRIPRDVDEGRLRARDSQGADCTWN